ncbi:O-antigen ligase family protein [Vibrio coralliirubri]|uniref:O-antigen ligase family protein n=1 Tax=Vibrio coralliirubri TaxID=1516159 RepID=UPI000B351CF5|nr:O-antigen ligase family protein [Vibrio coralliirubri]
MKSLNYSRTNNNYKFNNIIFYIIALTGPLSTTFLDKYNLIFTIIIVSLGFVLRFRVPMPFQVDNISKLFICSYSCLVLIGTLSLFISSLVITDSNALINTISRTVTLLLGISLVLLVSDWTSRTSIDNLQIFIKCSFYITTLFLFFAVYQYVAFNFNLPFIETRSYAYGVEYSMRESLGLRLTSISREPNFYSPIIFEGVFLAFIYLRRSLFVVFLVISGFVIVKTLSTGAYLHSMLLLCACMVFGRFDKKYKIMVSLSLIVFLLIALFYYSESNVINYFLNKLSAETSGDSYRSLVLSWIASAFFDSNIIKMIFGNGTNSLMYFSELSNVNVIDSAVFSISNNLILDFAWDYGIIGIFVFLLFVLIAFKEVYFSSGRNQVTLACLFIFLSFCITCLYRSEYTTTHFYWVLCNIIVLNNLGRRLSKR